MAWKDWVKDFSELTAPVWGDASRRRKFTIVAGFVLLLWLLWALLGARAFRFVFMRWASDSRENEIAAMAALGQTGDVFGGVNALFAAFAFIGVAVAAYFQYQTFKQLEEQHKVDRFEPIFFKLLELFHEMREQLDPAVLHADRSGVDGYAKYVLEDVGNFVREKDSALEADRSDALNARYDDRYKEHELVLGPYFRSLYHIFKRIHTSGLPQHVRFEYANIARSTLSPADLRLLLVNGASFRGAEFRPLMEGYGLLKHLPRRSHPHAPRPEQLASFLIENFYLPCICESSSARLLRWKDPDQRPDGFFVELKPGQSLGLEGSS